MKSIKKTFSANGLTIKVELEGRVDEEVGKFYNSLVHQINLSMQDVMNRVATEKVLDQSQKQPEGQVIPVVGEIKPMSKKEWTEFCKQMEREESTPEKQPEGVSDAEEGIGLCVDMAFARNKELEEETIKDIERRYQEWKEYKKEFDKKAEVQLERFKYKPEKQEEWSDRLLLLSPCKGLIGDVKSGKIKDIELSFKQSELLDFISQLLSERTFNKEELNFLVTGLRVYYGDMERELLFKEINSLRFSILKEEMEQIDILREKLSKLLELKEEE